MNDEKIVKPLNKPEVLTLEEIGILIKLSKSELETIQGTIRLFQTVDDFKKQVENLKQFEIKLSNLLRKLQ